ncbi:MAG: tetratricopeptide repeat protein [Treponema sp.]|nr:tetratricopeptide repeat protein [Treponema sp.]
MAKDLILTKAQNAVMSHDWTTAAKLYKELLHGNESNVDYLKELGSIYVKAGEDEKAIPYYEQIITFYPHYIEAMNSLGAIYRRLKRYEESIQILQRAKDEGRDSASVNYNYGFTCKEMGNYEDAIAAFESVIAENPDDVLAYNHLGSIYYAQKEYDKSIAAFKRGLQVDPNHPILNYNLARCYEAANSYPDAVRCYNAALKTRPGWTDAIHDFSGLLVKCQQTKAAQDLVEQSIKLHPMNTDLLYILGKIFLNQFDYSNASRTLKKADSIKGSDINILSTLAQALEKGAKPQEAMEKVLEAMDIEPENKDIQKQYAHTLLSNKEYDRALENIKELYDNGGESDPEVLDLYGQYYICEGEEDKASEYYKKIQTINHHYKSYMLEAADRFTQTGNYERAERYAKDFIERRSKSPEGYAKLGHIYEVSGNLQNARAFYEKSVVLSGGSLSGHSELKRLDDALTKLPSAEEIVQSILVPEEENAEKDRSLIEEQESETADTNASVSDEAVVYEEAPSLHDLAENDGDFDAAVFGNNEEAEEMPAEANAVPDAEEEPALPSAEELGLDSLSKDENNEPFDFSQMGDSIPLTDELAEEAENDFWNEFDNKGDNEEAAENPPVQAEEKPLYQEEMPPLQSQPVSQALSDSALAAVLDSQRRTFEMADRLKDTEDFIKETVDKAVDEAVDKAVDKAVDRALEEKIPDFEKTESAEPEEEQIPDDGFANQDFNDDDMMDESFMDTDMFEEEFMDVDSFAGDCCENYDAMDEAEIADISAESGKEEVEEIEEAEDVEEVEEAEEAEVIPEAEDQNSSDYMLEKIQRILNDTELQAVSADKIELFKMLRALLAFLPESDKNKSITRRMNMLLAYLIDKFSGKPGLLATAESLIKSGVLGDEYLKNLICEKTGEVSNSLITKVLTDMKKLSEDLSDRDVAKALCASADGILEQIELENQKSQIF